jgi:hypothetical protein
MKRLIASVSLAALCVPAIAAGLPYSQITIDRALPEVPKRVAGAKAPHAAPYEQYVIDRRLPDIDVRRSASAGDTRSSKATSPWVNDFRFIAPPR